MNMPNLKTKHHWNADDLRVLQKTALAMASDFEKARKVGLSIDLIWGQVAKELSFKVSAGACKTAYQKLERGEYVVQGDRVQKHQNLPEALTSPRIDTLEDRTVDALEVLTITVQELLDVQKRQLAIMERHDELLLKGKGNGVGKTRVPVPPLASGVG